VWAWRRSWRKSCVVALSRGRVFVMSYIVYTMVVVVVVVLVRSWAWFCKDVVVVVVVVDRGGGRGGDRGCG